MDELKKFKKEHSKVQEIVNNFLEEKEVHDLKVNFCNILII